VAAAPSLTCNVRPVFFLLLHFQLHLRIGRQWWVGGHALRAHGRTVAGQSRPRAKE
jgi:hypothetical protein